MRGDPYKLLRVFRSPLEARPDAWPGRIILAIFNERNTVTVFSVWRDDGTLLLFPLGMEDEVESLEQAFGEAVRGCAGSTSISPA